MLRHGEDLSPGEQARQKTMPSRSFPAQNTVMDSMRRTRFHVFMVLTLGRSSHSSASETDTFVSPVVCKEQQYVLQRRCLSSSEIQHYSLTITAVRPALSVSRHQAAGPGARSIRHRFHPGLPSSPAGKPRVCFEYITLGLQSHANAK